MHNQKVSLKGFYRFDFNADFHIHSVKCILLLSPVRILKKNFNSKLRLCYIKSVYFYVLNTMVILVFHFIELFLDSNSKGTQILTKKKLLLLALNSFSMSATPLYGREGWRSSRSLNFTFSRLTRPI